ncbi:hypothetical protein Gferi_00280 [Geosporobacter ferrireducens]|uniref:N(6)-L-threonylcarbamoyladenine synthase n=1 Tax=Geosporobacter ferrireducens TaxID=1424294 RepID=A0A1D8GB73_9FIRM|nr:hypothetical protein Gferi_00280 [Geosporobacter ferrireducens]
MEGCVLGIDTSNYTTSVAIVDFDGSLIYQNRILLDVKMGERGLRQSDALFQHVKNMPLLLKALDSSYRANPIKAVAVSSKPRPLEDSYMPVFLAGISFGETIANLLGINCYTASHQENHLEAALWSLQKTFDKPFLAVHISGGTTEILQVFPHPLGYNTTIIGGTADISAGQLVDRVGVAMGLPFPAGKHLDAAALQEKHPPLELPVSVKDGWINFSGVETKVLRMLGGHPEAYGSIAKALLLCIAKSLDKAILYGCKQHNIQNVLLMGGVASSQVVRTALSKQQKQDHVQYYFGKQEFCTDHAVGTALLGLKKYLAS